MKYFLIVSDQDHTWFSFDLDKVESIELHEEPEQLTTIKKHKVVKCLSPIEFIDLFKAIR